MSAYMVDKVLIDGLLTYGLRSGRPGDRALSWTDPAWYETEEYQRAYVTGEPFGPRDIFELFRTYQRELTEETAGRVGAMLWLENRRSVDFRYDEEEIEEPYVFECFPRASGRVLSVSAGLRPVPDYELKPVQVFQGLGCYEYQACEHPGWRTSEAHAFCRALEQRAIKLIPCETPGWWHDRETAW